MIERKIHIISITKIVVFIIIFLIICLVLSYFTKPNFYEVGIVSGFYGEKKNSLDVVYIGGSACFVYWEPLKAYEDYGIISYDFASNSMQAELYSYMIKEILQNQNPKLIIIDARAFQYRDKDLPPSDVAYRNLLTGMPLNINKIRFVEKYVRGTLKEKNALSYYFDFIKFHSAEDKYSVVDGIRFLLNKYKHDNKGFEFITKYEKQKFVDYETTDEMKGSKETINILDDLLEYLQTTNHDYLFVVSPYIEQKNHKKNYNYISKKIEKAGYKFIDANDYRDEMQIDYSKDFYNYGHVNIFGADKYTDFLAKYIVDNYSMKDRRKDKRYKEWNKLLKKWNKNKENTKEAINRLIIQYEIEEQIKNEKGDTYDE